MTRAWLIGWLGIVLIAPAALAEGDETLRAALSSRPDWLFADPACPADLELPAERPIRSVVERCQSHPDACLSECRDADPNACYSLAVTLQRAQGDDEATQALFLRACRLGISSGCTNYAAGLVASARDEASPRCAHRTFEVACERRDGWGCTMLGLGLMRGKGIARDPERARSALERACKSPLDNGPACLSARKLLERLAASPGPDPD